MSQRQLAMILDLNKCIGCHTCSIACKRLWTHDDGMDYMWWHTVNTAPGKGTPHDWENMGGGYRDGVALPGQLPSRRDFGEAWDYNYDEVYGGGKPANEAYLQVQGEQPNWGPNWDEDQGAGEYPNGYYFYIPRLCNHCTHAACADACPRGAIYKRDEDGIVLINEERCRGYRFCMEACPYKKIYFNHVKGVAQKCIFCYPRIEQGIAPACARQCPGRLRFVGYLDDPDGPIWKLVNKWKVALPLHPEYGTEPNVFYVPPVAPPRIDGEGDFDESEPRIPNEHLISLFGEEVLDALEILAAEMQKTRDGEKSELMDLLIVYDWKDMFGGFDQDPATVEQVAVGGCSVDAPAFDDEPIEQPPVEKPLVFHRRPLLHT